MKNWFEVDRAGLAKLLERRGKGLIVGELIQNGWDEAGVTQVSLSVARKAGERDVTVTIEDDSPDGFHNLSHAYTLFAPSKKVGDPLRRGRFNLGDKLVLALAKEARLVSTKGGWRFDEAGRHSVRERRPRGSLLTLRMTLTREDQQACDDFARRLLPPTGIATFYNGVAITPRTTIATAEACLATEQAGADGVLRGTYRTTDVRIFDALTPGKGWLYELGIPVVETGDDYDCDIGQKVPLNLDRTNVTPSFLRDVRAAALNAMHGKLTTEQANSPWARDALESSDIKPDAVRSAFTARFSGKAVIYDPSDPEANNRAASEGYVVVHGAQLSAMEWHRVRESGVAKPAGQVFPSKPQGVAPTEFIDDWSDAMAGLAWAVERIGLVLLQRKVEVQFIRAPGASTIADYNRVGPTIRFNLGRLPSDFAEAGLTESTVDLLLHEFGHEASGDHLSAVYHESLTKLGARLAIACAADPGLLECEQPKPTRLYDGVLESADDELPF